jgi:hypothetical protein
MNRSLKDILREITDCLESLGATLGAHEAVLLERGLVTKADIDRNVDTVNVNRALANVRYWIAALPD